MDPKSKQIGQVVRSCVKLVGEAALLGDEGFLKQSTALLQKAGEIRDKHNALQEKNDASPVQTELPKR